jgi:serine/threonine protein kinase
MTTEIKTNQGPSGYEFIRKLGKGAYGFVGCYKSLSSGIEVAIKTIKGFSETTFTEQTNLKKLKQHPNLIKTYEILNEPSGSHIIMEYIPESKELKQFIREKYILPNSQIPTKAVLQIFRQMLDSLKSCHDQNIVHRDIKAENYLIDKHDQIKMIDFGLGREFTRGRAYTQCGTLTHMAPEMFISKSGYDAKKIDIWSLGITLYQLSTGLLPFDHKNDDILINQILFAPLKFPPNIDPSLAKLITLMLERNPNQRVSLEELMTDPILIAKNIYSTSEIVNIIAEYGFKSRLELMIEADRLDLLTKEEVIIAVQTAVAFDQSAIINLLARWCIKKDRLSDLPTSLLGSVLISASKMGDEYVIQNLVNSPEYSEIKNQQYCFEESIRLAERNNRRSILDLLKGSSSTWEKISSIFRKLKSI